MVTLKAFKWIVSEIHTLSTANAKTCFPHLSIVSKIMNDWDTGTHLLPRVEISSVLTSFLQVITATFLLGTFSSYFCTKESLLVHWLPHWLFPDNPFTPIVLLGSTMRTHLFLKRTNWRKSLAALVLTSLPPAGLRMEYFQAIPPIYHIRGSVRYPIPPYMVLSHTHPQTHLTQPGTHSCPDPPYMDKYPP